MARELLAAELLKLGGKPPSFTYGLVSYGDSDHKGKLVWSGGGQDFELAFKSKQWAILRYLARETPRAVPIDELVLALKLNSESSFRSAYQRLDTTLRREGLDITVNVRPKRYRCTVTISEASS